MGATIEVSDEFHEWLRGRRKPGESMEDALRRLLAAPEPAAVEDLLTDAELERAVATSDNLQNVDRDRLEVARETFSNDGSPAAGDGDEEA